MSCPSEKSSCSRNTCVHDRYRVRKEMALNKPRQTRRELPLEDKCRLIREKESVEKSCKELAEIFSIGKSQVPQIMKRKVEYLDAYEENAPADRKRVKVSQSKGMQDVDNLTFKWFQQLGETIFQCLDRLRHVTTPIKQQLAVKGRA